MKAKAKRDGKVKVIGDTPDFTDEDIDIAENVWDGIGRDEGGG